MRIIIAITLLTLVFSCQKIEKDIALQDDPVFQAYALKATATIERIANAAQTRGTRGALLFAKNEQAMKEVLGSETYEKVKAQAIEADALMSQLKKRHRVFNQSEVEDAFRKVLAPVERSEVEAGGPIPIQLCHWAYVSCVVAAGAAGMLCHAGCTSATVGFGVAGCFILCMSVQAHAMASCYIEFCEKYAREQWEIKQKEIKTH